MNDNDVSVDISAPVDTPAPLATDMIPKSQVDSIVHGRLKDSTAKIKADYDAKLSAERAKWESQSSSSNSQSFDREQLLKEAESRAEEKAKVTYRQQVEEAQQHQFNEEIKKIGNDINAKFAGAKEKYPDFDQVVSRDLLADDKVAALAFYANQFDNMEDVMYDLCNNGVKLGSLMNLPPTRIQAELARLSQSLKSNEAAENRPQSRAPLSKLTASNVPNKPDNDNLPVADLSHNYKGGW